MFKKLNKKGFTLAELLVVVAIIGVLVAVSIPIFTSQLAKAKVATNQANVRAGKAAAVSEYLMSDGDKDAYYLYDVATGKATLKTAAEAKGAQTNDKLTTVGIKITAGTNSGEATTDPAISSITTAKVYGELGTFGN